MPSILKLFFRLDFEYSVAFLNGRGTALKALTHKVPDMWTSYGDGRIAQSLAAESKKPDHEIAINLEMTSINGTIEWFEPRQLEKLGSYEEFENLNKVLSEVLKAYDVRVMTRAGIRPICVTSWSRDKLSAVDEFRRYASDAMLQTLNDLLGEPSDVGLIVEGVTTDKINYRVHCGPLRRRNLSQYLPGIKEDYARKLLAHDLLCDIDLYEKNISFVEHSFYRWSATKIATAQDLLDGLAKSQVQAKN